MPAYPWLEKTRRNLLSFIGHTILAEDIADRPGFLQSLDPRMKAATMLAFIVAALFVKSLPVLGLAYVLCLALAALSRVSLWFFLKRTWIFIPLFSVFIALPALFSFVTPGQPLFKLGPALITRPGALGAALFVTRVTVSVSFAVLLSITTRHFELLKVLRIFGIPSIFVMVLSMSWRYICLFVEMLENTTRAIKSRVGFVSHVRGGQRLAAWNMASLWARSFQLNENVYDAMRSRGYTGEVVLLQGFKTQARDWVWAFSASLVIFMLIAFGR
jgi:cobalt/nickel transport system permease protein